MSLDNVEIPSIVLQNLFKNTLVDITGKTSAPNSSTKGELSFLGDNKKNICIVVTNEKAIYLPDEDLNFLIGILAACKLTMADVALINLKKNPTITYTDLQTQLKSETILLMGTTAEQLALPLQFPQYQIQKFNNQVYLAAPALYMLAQSKPEKTKLWNCLKQIFNIA